MHNSTENVLTMQAPVCYPPIALRNGGDAELTDDKSSPGRLARVLTDARGPRTNKEWANEIGVAPSTITRWIQGTVKLSSKNVDQICSKDLYGGVTRQQILDAAELMPPSWQDYVNKLNEGVNGIRSLYSGADISDQQKMLDALSSAGSLYERVYQKRRKRAGAVFEKKALQPIAESKDVDGSTISVIHSERLISSDYTEIPDASVRYQVAYTSESDEFIEEEGVTHPMEDFCSYDAEKDLYYFFKDEQQNRLSDTRLDSRLRAIVRDRVQFAKAEIEGLCQYAELYFEDEGLFSTSLHLLNLMEIPLDISLELFYVDVENEVILQSEAPDFIFPEGYPDGDV